jgi:hypothetical protein
VKDKQLRGLRTKEKNSLAMTQNLKLKKKKDEDDS